VFFAAGALCFAESWAECHRGPFRVFSSAGDKAAREKLAELEQFRHALGVTIGVPDIQTIWPVHVLVSSSEAPSEKLVLGRDAYEVAYAPRAPIPEGAKAELARVLLEQGTLHIPRSIEDGLVALFSTLQVNGVHVTVGAPPPQRTRDWARMQMLIANPETYGEVRVFFSNLEHGADLDTAYQNAFQKRGAAIEKQVDEYLRAGNFPTNSINALPLNEERDLRVHPIDKVEGDMARADLLLTRNPAAAADLYRGVPAPSGTEGQAFAALAAGKKDDAYRLFGEAAQAGSKNANAWYQLGLLEPDNTKKRADLDKAAQLNSHWDAPFLALAETEPGPVRRAFWLKKACDASPRNTDCWVHLAQADEKANKFEDAVKAWALAENSAPNDAEREQIRKQRFDAEQQRNDYEIAERKREEAARQADLDRVKNATLADIRAAEAKANAKLGAESSEGAVSWSDLTKGEAKVDGTLGRIECTGKQMRLVITTDQGPVRVLAEPERVSLEGDVTTAKLACGSQDPARKVTVRYDKLQGRRSAGLIGQATAIVFR